MKEYRYSGPTSGVTPSGGAEILLWPGRAVSLPKGYDYVKVPVALKHPTSEPEDTKPAVTSAMQSPKRRSGSDSEVKTEDAHDG